MMVLAPQLRDNLSFSPDGCPTIGLWRWNRDEISVKLGDPELKRKRRVYR